MPFDIDTEPAILEQYEPRSSVFGGTGAILLATFLAIPACGIAYVTFLGVAEEGWNLLTLLLALGAYLFTVAALTLLLRGVRDRTRQRASDSAASDGEAWRDDHTWTPVARELAPRWALIATMRAVRLLPAGVVGVWLVVASDVTLLFRLFAGVLVAAVVFHIGMAVVRWMRLAQRDTTTLRLSSAPFFLGAPLQTNWHRDAAGDEVATVVLRCVEDDYHYSTNLWDTYARVKQRWAISGEVPVDAGADTVSVSIPLPDDPELSTRLRHRPPRYWILELGGPDAGLGQRAYFLVPVYAPAAAATPA